MINKRTNSPQISWREFAAYHGGLHYREVELNFKVTNEIKDSTLRHNVKEMRERKGRRERHLGLDSRSSAARHPTGNNRDVVSLKQQSHTGTSVGRPPLGSSSSP